MIKPWRKKDLNSGSFVISQQVYQNITYSLTKIKDNIADI